MLRKGFTGIALITEGANKLPLRFLSADFSLNQGVNVYLPSYEGNELRKIISPMTGNITGRINSVLIENTAQDLYDLTYNAPWFDVELYFYDGTYRKFEDTRVENLTFDCKAGELVSFSLDVTSMLEEDKEIGDYNSYIIKSVRTTTQKIVQWTQTHMLGIFDGEMSAFSYSVKNNLVVVKTTKSLLPRAINRGIQEVSGNAIMVDVVEPPRDTDIDQIFETEVDFKIDNFSNSHRVAAHWSYRTPLSPDLITTTLDWLRVDEMG